MLINGYNDMLGSTDVDSTAGKYMFKKVSREILNLIGELSQLFFTGNAQSISDKLGILFSENSYDFDKVFILLDKLKREIDEFPAKYRVLFIPCGILWKVSMNLLKRILIVKYTLCRFLTMIRKRMKD